MQIAVIPNESGLRELMLIELQGVFEPYQNVDNVEFAKLHWSPNGTPYLRIGHNQFEGKSETLEKPYLVMDKTTKNFELKEDGSEPTKATVSVEGIIERKLIFNIRPRPVIASPGNAFSNKSVNGTNIFGGNK